MALLSPLSALASFDVSLKYGMSGLAVLDLQELLVSDNCLSVSPTGYFGSLTLAGVKCFQTKHSLPSTGYFGVLSRGVANTLLADLTKDSDEAEQAETGIVTPVVPTQPTVIYQTPNVSTVGAVIPQISDSELIAKYARTLSDIYAPKLSTTEQSRLDVLSKPSSKPLLFQLTNGRDNDPATIQSCPHAHQFSFVFGTQALQTALRDYRDSMNGIGVNSNSTSSIPLAEPLKSQVDKITLAYNSAVGIANFKLQQGKQLIAYYCQ